MPTSASDADQRFFAAPIARQTVGPASSPHDSAMSGGRLGLLVFLSAGDCSMVLYRKKHGSMPCALGGWHVHLLSVGGPLDLPRPHGPHTSIHMPLDGPCHDGGDQDIPLDATGSVLREFSDTLPEKPHGPETQDKHMGR
jgi:hypothetical protein